MPKAPSAAEFTGLSADETEAAFYEALQTGDLERLMACWSDDEDIVCVHPGGPRIVGHAAIRSTFESIFANGSIQARPDHVRKIDGLSSAVHNVIERVDVMTPAGPSQACVLATNVYHQTRHGWRMVAHHASPGSAEPPAVVQEWPSTLH